MVTYWWQFLKNVTPKSIGKKKKKNNNKKSSWPLPYSGCCPISLFFFTAKLFQNIVSVFYYNSPSSQSCLTPIWMFFHRTPLKECKCMFILPDSVTVPSHLLREFERSEHHPLWNILFSKFTDTTSSWYYFIDCSFQSFFSGCLS